MILRRTALVGLALTACFLVAGGRAGAADLPRADPASVGLDPDRLARITATLRADVDRHVLPGAVLLIGRHGKIAYAEAVGARDPQSGGGAASGPSGGTMPADAIFRIYSMSKPVTVVAALMLAEEGKLAFSDPISKYLPEFAKPSVGVPAADPGGGDAPMLRTQPADRPITVQDLMRHSSGITYGFFGDTLVKKAYQREDLLSGDFTNAELVTRLARLPLAYQPGTTWDYSYSIDVLGRIVEVVSGKSLLQFEKERLLDPLGMGDTGFYVTDAAKQGRVAEPFADDRGMGVGLSMGDPRKAQAWESGGGGMVSTAADYARFLQMLLNGGTLDGRRYLGPATVAYMTADQMGTGVKPGPYYLPGPGYGFGLGVAVRKEAGVAPFPGNPGDWWWGGAGGTYFWVDPKADLFALFMMQSPKQRLYYRSLLRDMVYAAVTDMPGSAALAGAR